MPRRSPRIAGEPAPIQLDATTTATVVPRQSARDTEMKKLKTELKRVKTQLKTCKTKLTTTEGENRHIRRQLQDRDAQQVLFYADMGEMEEKLEEKSNELVQYKALCRDLTDAQINERANGGVGIPTCGICANQYSHVEDRTPRLLKCGHTVCLSCANNLHKYGAIICPFDRTTMKMTGRPAAKLLKNFSILDMCA